MTSNNPGTVFDYRALRLLMGLIALGLPFVVSFLASTSLSSISASYYSEARDAFVGMLFVVSAFLWAYNGHTPKEARRSKVASIAAILVALFPTSCDLCEANITSFIHYGAAAILFSILAYFCYVPFRLNTKGKAGKPGRRSKIYFVCGSIMIACMLAMFASTLLLPDSTLIELRITYWAEAISLIAFGIAWTVSGKYFSIFVDDAELMRLFGR